MYRIFFHPDGWRSFRGSWKYLQSYIDENIDEIFGFIRKEQNISNVIMHERHKLGLSEVLGVDEEGQCDVMNDVGPAQTSAHYTK